jgi:hypothetical protein
MSDSCNDPNLLLFGQGDLILLSCAVLAEASADLLETDTDIVIRRLAYILIGLVIVMTFLNALIYGSMDRMTNKVEVIKWSMSSLVISLSIGFVSKFLGKD